MNIVMKQIITSLACLLVCLLTACEGNEGHLVGGTDIPEQGVHMVASSFYILNDGNDRAEFTVYSNGKDVTTSPDTKIFQRVDGKNVLYGQTSFATTREGSYTFFAYHGTERTENITVNAITGILELPDDPQPEKYDGFRHRILGVQGTATGCQFCPRVIAALHELQKTDVADDILLVGSHGALGSDPMNNQWSDLVNGSSSLPFFKYNFTGSNLGNYNTVDAVTAAMESEATSLLAEAPSTGISAVASSLQGTLNVTAAVKVGQAGTYKVGVWVVEDGIYNNSQLNYYPDLDGKYDFTIHNNVLRYISGSDQAGELLGGEATTQAGQTKQFVHEVSMSNLDIADAQKVRVLVVVAKKTDRGFSVDNVISVALNSQQAFEYEQ